MKRLIQGLFFLALTVMILLAVPQKVKAENNYSTNVSVETNAYNYYCAQGQKFKVEITVRTEETYQQGSHKYIGYLAFLENNNWQQIKAWYIDGGVVKYTFTLDSSDYAQYYTKPYLMFTASVFPIDSFEEGASLYDQMFQVSFLNPSFELTYNANGGRCDTLSGSAIYHCPYGELPIPVRNGYFFSGWYTDSEGGTRVESDTLVTEQSDHTLYAHWEPETYSVSFDANGGYCRQTEKNVSYDSVYGALPEPVRTDCIFKGWYTQRTGGNKISEDSRVTIAQSHTLYARWGVSHEIRFDANGGTCQTESKAVSHNGTYGTMPIPVRTGYQFAGWYTLEEGGEEKTEDDRAAESHTLYAHWKPKTYVISFHANGGKCSTGNKKVAYQSTYGTLPMPSRKDYKFTGWYTKKSGGSKISSSTTMETASNQTLYARWQVVKPSTVKPSVKINSADSVKISWKKVSGAKGYIVYRSNSKSGTFKKCADVKKTSYIDEELRSGRVYYYRVCAYKKVSGKNVYGKQSQVVQKKVIGPLSKPINEMQFDRVNKTYTLSWKSIKNAQKVEIYGYVDDNTEAKQKVETVSAGKKSVTYSYAELARGHKYSFYIRAYYKVDGKKIYSKNSDPQAFRRN